MQKEYRGKRLDTGVEVTVDGSPLDPRYDLRQLSQSGFEWGYGGAGPMQLALAILADHFGGDGSRALNAYKRFCELKIAEIDAPEWVIGESSIDSLLSETTDVPLTLDQLLRKVRQGN